MLGTGLAPDEVARRLIRLPHLEFLHAKQKQRIEKLVSENKALKQRVAALTAIVTAQSATIEDLKLQMEEMRAIVFGKKRKRKDEGGDDFPPTPVVSCEPRARESYRRKLPAEDEITDTKRHPTDRCAHCGGPVGERESKTYYEEDIPLPQRKIIVRHVVERGYCEACVRWSSATALPSAPVVLGPNVQRYVCYLNVVCRQPYAAIEDILQQSYDFNISQGEIAKIMEREGNRLRPEYARLKAKIRGEPSIHLDETGWKLLAKRSDRGFAWTMVGGQSGDAVFALGKSRGKGNADELVGDSEAAIVSDDYGAYDHFTEHGHQRCWSHPLRKLRDLARSGELAGTARVRCATHYETFAALYADLETARTSSDPSARHDALLARLKTFSFPDHRDPLKLARVKASVKDHLASYLTCLRRADVAPTNNAAERSLRHLVIKRKISFGSFSERTAETMAILLSVLMSWKRRGGLRDYLAGV